MGRPSFWDLFFLREKRILFCKNKRGSFNDHPLEGTLGRLGQSLGAASGNSMLEAIQDCPNALLFSAHRNNKEGIA